MRKKKNGQTAVLFTLILMVIFIFMTITINVGMLAERKNHLSNTADAAALLLASRLGSLAHALSQQYVDGQVSIGRGLNPALIGEIFTFIISAVTLVVAPNPYSASGLTGSFVGITESTGWSWLFGKNLSSPGRLMEEEIAYALFNTVDDPVKVIDRHDADGDGRIDDQVPRLSVWYQERMRRLDFSLQDYINDMSDCINSVMVRLALFYELLSERTQSRSLLEDENNHFPGEYFLGFMNREFIPLLQDMRDCGYQVSFWQPGDNTQEDGIDRVLREVNLFRRWILVMIGKTMAVKIRDVDIWGKELYDKELRIELRRTGQDESDSDDYYQTMTGYQNALNNWIVELERINQNIRQCAQDSTVVHEDGQAICEGCCCSLSNRVEQAVTKLRWFSSYAGRTMEGALNFINCVDSISDPYLTRHEPVVTYSWHDSRGWHHVRIEGTLPVIPNVREYTRWFQTRRRVEPSSGEVTCAITRYDQDLDRISFANRLPFWRFRFRNNPQQSDVRQPDEIRPRGGVIHYDELGLPVADERFKRYQGEALARGITSMSRARWVWSRERARIIEVR